MNKRIWQAVMITGGLLLLALALPALRQAQGAAAQRVAAQDTAGTPADTPSSAEAGSVPAEHAALPAEPALDPADVRATTTYWRVAGSAFKPRASNVSYDVNSQGGCVYVTAGSTSTVWSAVPQLPQGASVSRLRLYFNDTSASNAQAWFTIYDLYGNIEREVLVTTDGNAGNSFRDSAAINHTVNYAAYSYLLNWRPLVTGNSMQLCGMRLTYESPFGATFLPALERNP